MKQGLKNKLIAVAILISAVVVIVEMEKAAEHDHSTCQSSTCLLPPELVDSNGETNVITTAQTGLPRLIDFGANRCATCKMMTGVLNELANEAKNQLAVQFVDTRENEALTEQYGIRIIPTQVFMDKDGIELYRHEGFISKEDILKKWSELGIELQEPNE